VNGAFPNKSTRQVIQPYLEAQKVIGKENAENWNV
jgi:hypothetical protein